VAQRARAALLLYLAVAHYGRGRGDWVQGEAPPHWPPLVDEVVRPLAATFEAAWRMAGEGVDVDDVATRLQSDIAAAARELLVRLYPEARDLL
jgi:hypothetical protein